MGGAVRVGGVVRAHADRQSAAGGDASVVSHALNPFPAPTTSHLLLLLPAPFRPSHKPGVSGPDEGLCALRAAQQQRPELLGAGGCVSNASLLAYNTLADSVLNYSSGTLIMLLAAHDRPLVERITGYEVRSVLGLPAPTRDLYAVPLYGSLDAAATLKPFTDLLPLVPPDIITRVLAGKATAGPPISTAPGSVTSGECANPCNVHPTGLCWRLSPCRSGDKIDIVYVCRHLHFCLCTLVGSCMSTLCAVPHGLLCRM
ncbi:hypothetical protein CLOM_g8066, partial [Closterium sp. NIES-68]